MTEAVSISITIVDSSSNTEIKMMMKIYTLEDVIIIELAEVARDIITDTEESQMNWDIEGVEAKVAVLKMMNKITTEVEDTKIIIKEAKQTIEWLLIGEVMKVDQHIDNIIIIIIEMKGEGVRAEVHIRISTTDKIREKMNQDDHL